MTAPHQPGSGTVLVVGGEAHVVELLPTALRLSGFEVHSADSGTAAMKVAAEHEPDIAVVDVALPDRDGFQLAQRLRAEHPQLPVLFLLPGDAPRERIPRLTAGGDDCVTKPFSHEELALKLRALLGRTRRRVEAGGGRLCYADLELDEDAHQAWRNGRSIPLSPTEFNLLRYLLINSEKVVSKSQILDRVWNYQFGGDSRIVESYISYLRRKIDTEDPPLIHTVRGVGYSLRRPRGAALSRGRTR